MLGGVVVPFDRGLDGWSDADVCTHAVIEALLGAAALGDIGTHFPTGDARYKDISSINLLQQVKAKLAASGWGVGNIDVTVVTEEPRLAEYLDKLVSKLSNALGIETDRVSVKASTNNGLGSLGRNEGIAAYAVALIESVG